MNILSILTFFLSGNIWSNLFFNPSDKIVRFNILLKQKNIDIIEKELLDRSDPYSNNYGKWLEKYQIDNIVKPDNYKPLIEWLDNNDVFYMNYTDNLLCASTVKEIHKLFNTSLNKHHQTIYTIPSTVKPHVDMILGMSSYYYNKDLFKPIYTDFKEDPIISPESIYHLYNVSYPNHVKHSSQSVAEFLGDSCYNNESLQIFLNNSGMSNISIPKERFLGNCNVSSPDPDIEATLDIQYQTGINNNTELYYISVSDWLYQFSTFIYHLKSPPKVISMSWGWAEWDQCDPSVMPTCLLNVSAEQYTKRTNIFSM